MSTEQRSEPGEQLVTSVIADLLDLDPDQLTAATTLAGIGGWDSVNALRVLVYLERQVGQSLDYDQFSAAATIGDLASMVASASREGSPR